jgi:hypothetical protein
VLAIDADSGNDLARGMIMVPLLAALAVVGHAVVVLLMAEPIRSYVLHCCAGIVLAQTKEKHNER